MATNLTRLRPATITIDGQAVRINCRRLKLEEAEAHRAFLKQIHDEAKKGELRLSDEQAQYVRTSIEHNISVPPGELSVDSEPVTTGAQLLELVGESGASVMRLMYAIAGAVGVSEREGKPSASERDSVPSSDEPVPAPVGPRPVTTADAAAPADTAPTEDATGETATPSSGPMAILN